MKLRETVLATTGQIKDLASVLVQAIPTKQPLSFKTVEYLIGNKSALLFVLRTFFETVEREHGHIDKKTFEFLLLAPESFSDDEKMIIRRHVMACFRCGELQREIVHFYWELEKELKRPPTKEDIEFARKLVAKKEEKKNILTIRSNFSLEYRIARGKYDWVNSDITEKNFPTNIPADYDVEYKLLHFNRAISSDDTIREMEHDGFRPATLPELLTLGETEPELQKQFPIIALGSVWQILDGGRSVPVLNSHDSRRLLDLDWFEDDWYGVCRFLAVRK